MRSLTSVIVSAVLGFVRDELLEIEDGDSVPDDVATAGLLKNVAC